MRPYRAVVPFLLIALTVVSIPPLSAQTWEGSATLAVRVTNNDGDPVSGANVLARMSEGDPNSGPASVPTGAGGEALISGLAEGEWFVEISHAGYMLYAAYVDLKAGKKPQVGFSSQVNTEESFTPMKVRFVKASPSFNRSSGRTKRAERSEAPAVVRPAPEPEPTRRATPTVVRPAPTTPEPEAPEPEAAEPESAEPESPQPESLEPESTEPESTEPIEATEVPTPETEAPTPPRAAPSSEAMVPPSEPQSPTEDDPVIPAPEAPAPETRASETPEPEVPTAEERTPATSAADVPTPETAEESSSATVPTTTTLPEDSVSEDLATATDAVSDVPDVDSMATEAEEVAVAAAQQVPTPSPAPETPTPPAPASDLPAPVEAEPSTLPEPPAVESESLVAEEDAASTTPAPGASREIASETAPSEVSERAATPPSPATETSPEPPPSASAGRIPRYLRSAASGTCAECEPGEWAVAAEQVAARSGDGPEYRNCSGTFEEDARRGAELLADIPASRLDGYAGPILTALFRIAPGDDRRQIQDLLTPLTEPEAYCQLAGVVLPRSAAFSGYVLEAWDSLGGRSCRADVSCAVGQARWLYEPVVVEGSERIVVYDVFKNRSSRRERRARMTIYFQPPVPDWSPGR